MGEMWSSPMLVKAPTANSTQAVRSYLSAWLEASITTCSIPLAAALASWRSSWNASGVVSFEIPASTPSSNSMLENSPAAWRPARRACSSSTLFR